MKVHATAITCLLVSLGLARSSSADAVPAWCSTRGVAELVHDEGHLANALDDALKDNVVAALRGLVLTSCAAGTGGRSEESATVTHFDLNEHRGEIAAARQRWSQQLDLTEADWADVAEWAQANQSQRNPGLGTLRLESIKQPWSSFSPLEQFLFIAGPGHVGSEDFAYWADALDTKLSQLGRFAFIEQCLEGEPKAKEVRWAVCQADIAAFDPSKLAIELRQAKASGYQRTIIRLDVARIRAELPAHAEDVKATIAKDPAYGKVFQVAAAARKVWAERVGADSPLLALASAMDDARVSHSNKAYDGCGEASWNAWKAAIAKEPAKAFENLHEDRTHTSMEYAIEVLTREPDGYLAALAMATCTAGQSNASNPFNAALIVAVTGIPGFRGPRTAATTAVLNAGIQLDDRDAKLEFPHPDRSSWFGPQFNGGSGGGKGVIASIKPNGKLLHIVFTPKLQKQVQCAQARTTGEVTRVDPNGQLTYRQVCVQTKIVNANISSNPVDVEQRWEAGLRPGVYVEVASGVVEAVWSSSTSTTPSFVLGAPVR